MDGTAASTCRLWRTAYSRSGCRQETYSASMTAVSPSQREGHDQSDQQGPGRWKPGSSRCRRRARHSAANPAGNSRKDAPFRRVQDHRVSTEKRRRPAKQRRRRSIPPAVVPSIAAGHSPCRSCFSFSHLNSSDPRCGAPERYHQQHERQARYKQCSPVIVHGVGHFQCNVGSKRTYRVEQAGGVLHDIARDHQHGHGFADGAARGENDARGDAHFCRRQDDAANHAPA